MNKTALLICCNDKVEAVVIADNEELVKPRLEELARSHFETLSWQHAAYRDNRHTRTGKLGQFTVTITFRDTAQPDGYSHTDLYRMLTAIRRAEKDSGLRIPEPGQFTIESGPIDLT